MRNTLAKTPGLPKVAQDILATDPQLHELLAGNPTLHTEVWYKLYGPKRQAPVGLVYQLLKHQLSREQTLFALGDKRKTVLEQLAYTLVADDDLVASYLSKNPRNADIVLGNHHQGLSLASARRAAVSASGGALLLWMSRTCEPFTTEEGNAWIGKAADARAARVAWKLSERRPDLVPALARSRNLNILRGVASSRHLRLEDQEALLNTALGRTYNREPVATLVGLIRNPVTQVGVLERIEQWSESPSGHYGYLIGAAMTERRGRSWEPVRWDTTDAGEVESLVKYCTGHLPIDYDTSDRELAALHLGALVEDRQLPEALVEWMKSQSRNGWLRHVEPEVLVKLGRAPAEPVIRAVEDCSGISVKASRWTSHSRAAAAQWLVETLGEDKTTWENLLMLVEDFDGTFGDLVSIADGL